MEELELLDWKRRIFELYAETRADPQPERAWQHWCDVREELLNPFGTANVPSRS